MYQMNEYEVFKVHWICLHYHISAWQVLQGYRQFGALAYSPQMRTEESALHDWLPPYYGYLQRLP